MTSYETNATQAQWAKGQSSSSGSDFKKLKSKYASQLSTLKELFANWSDEDLLFAIQDADGDLELTIERISEGHVVQWGEVKTKKQKKEAAQKAKASQPASQQFTSSSSSTYNRERAHAARNHSERGRSGRGGSANRGNARTSKPPVAPHPQTAASWEKKTKAHHSSESQSFDKGGSWASIVSAPKTTVNDNSQIGNAATTGADGWDTPAATTTDDNWAKPTWDDQPQPESAPAPSPPPSTSANNDTSSSSAPKTWASLLKSKPKPEPSVDTKKEDQQGWQQSEAASTGDGRDAPKDGWNTAKSNENDAWTTPSADPWEQPVQMTSDAPPLKGEPVPEKTPEAKEEEPSSVAAEAINSSEKEQLSSLSPSSAANKAKQSVGRRLKQDAPVVLPNSGATISDVEVKFGSLGLEDSTEGDVRLGEPTKKQDSSATVDQAAEKQVNQSYLDRYPSNENGSAGQGANSLIGGESLGQASYIKQQDAATAAAANYIPQQPPQQQPQQQQQQQLNHLQQQHFGMENLTSPYSSYLPNQPPAGVSGFAMNPMASLPDYSLYGSDAQRAAASMGYYDPSAYSHSPSTTSASAYQARDKYGQDAASANAQTQMLPQQAQQMYPNMPYYHQYYYMPNHLFGAYQQSGYAQPYLNKNMYPMYQPSGKPGASATSPYGAAGGSPYVNHQTQQQHLYNPTIPGAAGYDDMSPLGALHDYQKPSYNQQQPQQQALPGFLGNLPQPSPGAQQPPANAGQQGQGKADVDNGQYAGNGSQQGANTQHFPQQHAYQQPNPSNYFNHHQPQQMFYPQQQFHMQPHQQQQQQQQQQAPQAPSMGRQQQYWNQ